MTLSVSVMWKSHLSPSEGSLRYIEAQLRPPFGNVPEITDMQRLNVSPSVCQEAGFKKVFF